MPQQENKRTGELDSEVLFGLKLDRASNLELKISPLDKLPSLPGTKNLHLRQGLAAAINEEAKLNFEKTVRMDNPQTSNVHEGIEAIKDYLQKEYFLAHKELLINLDIKDVTKLTPPQAFKLASTITMERLDYSHEQLQRVTAEAVNDGASIDQLLKWDKDPNGNGVCRNYARVQVGIFEALKSMQTEGQLDSSFMLTLENSSGNLVPGDVSFHAWNGALTILPDAVYGAVLDSTWGDDSKADPAQAGISSNSLDYSEERFFTLVERFVKAGLVSSDSFAIQLIGEIKNRPDSAPDLMSSSNIQETFRKIPIRMQLGERLIQLAAEDRLNVDNDHLVSAVQDYIGDLSRFVDSINDAPKILRKETLETKILLPMLNRIRVATEAIEKNLPANEKVSALNSLGEVFDKLRLNFSNPSYNPYHVDVAYQFFKCAEGLKDEERLKNIANNEISSLLKYPGKAHDWIVEKILSDLKRVSQSELENYRKYFGDKIDIPSRVESSNLNIRQQKFKKDHNLLLDTYFFSDQELGTVCEDISKAITEFKPADLQDVRIRDEKNFNPEEFTPSTITFSNTSTKEEIQERLLRQDILSNGLKKIASQTSANISENTFSAMLIPVGKEQLFLNNANNFFSNPEMQHLLRFRTVVIAGTEKLKEFDKPEIESKLFLDDYKPVEIVRRLSVNDVRTRELEKNRIANSKAFQELERSEYISYTSVNQAENPGVYLGTLKNYFANLSPEAGLTLTFNPVGLTVLDPVHQLYGYGEKLLKDGVPVHLVRSLNFDSLNKLQTEKFVTNHGNIEVDCPTSILQSIRFISSITREGQILKLVVEDEKILIQLPSGELSSSFKKGDRLNLPPSPTVQLDYTGEELRIFSTCTNDELKNGLTQCIEQYGTIKRAQSAARNSSNVEIKPFYEVFNGLTDENVTHFKNFAEQLRMWEVNLSEFRDATIQLGMEEVTIKADAKWDPVRFSYDGKGGVFEVVRFGVSAREIAQHLSALAKMGISVQESTIEIGETTYSGETQFYDKEVIAALKHLEVVAKEGKFKDFELDIVGKNLNFTQPKNSQPLFDGKIVIDLESKKIYVKN